MELVGGYTQSGSRGLPEKATLFAEKVGLIWLYCGLACNNGAKLDRLMWKQLQTFFQFDCLLHKHSKELGKIKNLENEEAAIT